MAQRHGDQATTVSVRSFLVADIRGYTSYTAAHGDEAAARLVEHFATLVSDGVTAWSGTLVELRGDEALAAFELPRSALRAAVELQTAFADESREHVELPLNVGIGLDAGEAVPVGDGFRGAALNRAARLCSAAEAGQTFASEGLIHLAGPVSDIEYAAPREIRAKGLDEPVGVVAVTATRDDMSARGPAATLGTPSSLPPQLDAIVPLAGRKQELGWLRWHWRRARHGHARSVIVSGIPGIGKTRLAAALAAVAYEDDAAVTYLPMAMGISEAALATKAHGGPALLVVDDIDAASSESVKATVDEAAVLDGPVLLLVTHRTEASAELLKSLEVLTPSSMRRELGPLDLEAVRISRASTRARRSISCRSHRSPSSRRGTRPPSTACRTSGRDDWRPNAWVPPSAARRRAVANCKMPSPPSSRTSHCWSRHARSACSTTIGRTWPWLSMYRAHGRGACAPTRAWSHTRRAMPTSSSAGSGWWRSSLRAS